MPGEENAGVPINSGTLKGTDENKEIQASTQDECARLRQQLESKEQENKELQDKYLRVYAEFDNYKKRIARDLEDVSKYANERLLKELLPVVDNLERAIFHTKDIQEPSKILEGLELVRKQFLEVLGKFGVSAYESHLQPFDPSLHQAMGEMASDEYEDRTVIEEIQRGYRLNDRILRPALVIVSKKKEPGETGSHEETQGQAHKN